MRAHFTNTNVQILYHNGAWSILDASSKFCYQLAITSKFKEWIIFHIVVFSEFTEHAFFGNLTAFQQKEYTLQPIGYSTAIIWPSPGTLCCMGGFVSTIWFQLLLYGLVRAVEVRTRPCLAVYVKFQSVFITTSKIGSQLLLASTSSDVLLGWGSEKAFNECLGVSNVFFLQHKPKRGILHC